MWVELMKRIARHGTNSHGTNPTEGVKPVHISRIVIDNFRSIRHAEMDLAMTNVFVGQNNHGKTNVFEALRWFFEGTKKDEKLDDIRFQRGISNEVSVQVLFEGAQLAVKRMKNATGQTKMKDVLGEEDQIWLRRSTRTALRRSAHIWRMGLGSRSPLLDLTMPSTTSCRRFSMSIRDSMQMMWPR